MSVSVLEQLCKGSFLYLRSDATELRRLMPQIDQLLPTPQPIFQEDETATPVVGFPVLRGRALERIATLVETYLEIELGAQIAYRSRGSFDSKAYASHLESYKRLLDQILENATVSSIGPDYVGIFWLLHSHTVASILQEIPRRLRRDHPVVAREHGDDIKYSVYFKWIDRVVALSYDIANRLAEEMNVGEDELFPPLLELMRDNVLIFTEDYLSPDLTELTSYFSGCLKVDGRDLRQRVKAVEEWQAKLLQSDPTVRASVVLTEEETAGDDPRKLLYRRGWMTYLARHPRWDAKKMPTEAQVQVWERLLDKIKEFEILQAMRKMIVPIEAEGGRLISKDRSTNMTWVGGPEVLELSPVTRPIDYGKPWVVNPVVQRFGLVYDITDFSATLSILGRAQKNALDNAFRLSAQFQRKTDSLASSLNLKLEKYLGDGAFYSGRHARQMLVLAIHLQRLYPEFVRKGYPFDRGMRIALNHGEYRLLPLETDERSGDARYEFFGHGLVELSRLTTGKKTQEIEGFKTYLVSQGYSDTSVNQFFAPMLQRNQELVSKIDEQRDFYAYINQTNTLINEGIVATEPFLEHLGAFDTMYYARQHGRGFIAFRLEEATEPLLIGVRKLGIAKFKGLEPMPVFEVVDGGTWDPDGLKEIPSQPLVNHLERLFTKTVTAKQSARQATDA